VVCTLIDNDKCHLSGQNVVDAQCAAEFVHSTLYSHKRDNLAAGVAVYFNSKLRTFKLPTYQSVSTAEAKEKPSANVENRENGA